jgi:hypothetical protein
MSITMVFMGHEGVAVMAYSEVEGYDANSYSIELTQENGEKLKNLYCVLGAKTHTETGKEDGVIYVNVHVVLPEQYDPVMVTTLLLTVLNHGR